MVKIFITYQSALNWINGAHDYFHKEDYFIAEGS